MQENFGLIFRTLSQVSQEPRRGSERQALPPSSFGRPQMWERVQVGFGNTGKKRKGPCTKQCAWRKHASCDTPTRAWRKHMPAQTLKHSKIQSRKDAPKMAILEAPCAQNALGRSTMRLPEALLPRNPTWESSHFWGLAIRSHRSHFGEKTWPLKWP